MLISIGLPRPGSARFVLRGRIRSYTKGDLRDLLRLARCRLLKFSHSNTPRSETACRHTCVTRLSRSRVRFGERYRGT